MPFVSRAQRRFMYSKDPKMAHKYEQKTPKDKQLPERVRPRKIGIRKSMGRQTRLSEFDPDWEDPDYGPVTEYHATANLPAVRREGIRPPPRKRSRRFYPEEMRQSPPERATFTTTDLGQARTFIEGRGYDPSRSGIVGVRTRGMVEPAFQMFDDMPTHVREGGVAPQRLVMVKSLLRKTPVRYLIRKTGHWLTDSTQLPSIDLESEYSIAEMQDIANFHQAMNDHKATPQIHENKGLYPNDLPFGGDHAYKRGKERGLFTIGGESKPFALPSEIGGSYPSPVFGKPEEFIHTVAQMYMSGNTRQHPEGHVLSIPLGNFSDGSIKSIDGQKISGLSALVGIDPNHKGFYVKSIVPIGSEKLPRGRYGPITHLRTKKNSSKHEKLVTEHGDAHVGDLGEFGGVDSETHSNYFSTMSRPEEEPTQEPKKIIRVKEDFNIHPELENLGFGVKNKKNRKLDFSNVKHEYGDYRKTNWESHLLIPNALRALAELQNAGEISEEDAFPYYEAIFNFWKGRGYADADEIFKPYYLNEFGIDLDPDEGAIKRVMDAHKHKMGIKKSRLIRIVKGRNVSKLLVIKPSRRMKKSLRVVS